MLKGCCSDILPMKAQSQSNASWTGALILRANPEKLPNKWLHQTAATVSLELNMSGRRSLATIRSPDEAVQLKNMTTKRIVFQFSVSLRNRAPKTLYLYGVKGNVMRYRDNQPAGTSA